MQKLRSLSLQCNRITKIQNLDKIVNLKELYLSENGIEKMEGLERIINLEILDVSYNQLSQIEGVETLTNLEEFWFSANKLSDFQQLSKLKIASNLTIVYFQGNPISSDLQYKRKLLLELPKLTSIDGLPVINTSAQVIIVNKNPLRK